MDNQQAFPIAWRGENGDYIKGMTLRDYFAGQAIASVALGMAENQRFTKENTLPAIAKFCYCLADAMLKEREIKD